MFKVLQFNLFSLLGLNQFKLDHQFKYISFLSEILTLLRGDDLIEDCVDDNLPVENESTFFTPHEADPDLLNSQQKRVLDQCMNYLHEKNGATQRTSRLKPLHLIVHGGPGTGKSFLTSCLMFMAQVIGVSVACLAYTGIAASNLPKGRTLHSFFGFTIEEKINEWSEDLSTNSLNRLRNKIDVASLGVLVIDEISYVSPEFLGQIDRRLRQIMAIDEDFGGLLVLLMGDFYQLPPVATSYTLYSAAVKLYFDPNGFDGGDAVSPRIHGTRLFSGFKLIELTQQMRCAGDQSHSTMLERMRNPQMDISRVDPAYLASLKPIKAEDFNTDPEWARTPIVVTSNMERFIINDIRSKAWSKHNNTPRFVWRIPLSGTLSSKITQIDREYIYGRYPQFTGSFVVNAPGFLTENINPLRGLSNGTPVSYHSLTLDPREDDHRILSYIEDNTGN